MEELTLQADAALMCFFKLARASNVAVIVSTAPKSIGAPGKYVGAFLLVKK